VHKKSINTVLDYIENHLEDDLSLKTLAAIANYSTFHFHRIFKESTNQTVNKYVSRKRIEKAAAILLRNPEVSISDLSLQNHFTSNSSFTRAFKNVYGISPTKFRKHGKGKYSKIRQVKSKSGQVEREFQSYVCSSNNKQMNEKIKVISQTEMHFACLNFIGMHNSETTFNELMAWAGMRGLLRHDAFKMATIFYDSLKITAPEQVRMKAGILINKPFKTAEGISIVTFPKGNYIKGHFEINLNAFEQSWTSMFMFMNHKGYEKSEQPAFQLHYNDFKKHPEQKCIVDLYVPITTVKRIFD